MVLGAGNKKKRSPLLIFANKISMTHAIKGVFCFVVMVNRTDDLTNWTDIVRRLVVRAKRFPALF